MNYDSTTFYNIEILNYTDMTFMQDLPSVNLTAEITINF